MSTYTTAAEVEASLQQLRSTFASGLTKSLAWRKWQLKQCWWMIADNEKELCRALAVDLNRHEFESYTTDILGLETDILEHIQHLEEWTADQKPDAGFLFGTLGKARVRKEPLGVALIIGAWNFPFLLLLAPMVAAIAAGCTVILKPSEVAVESQAVLQKLVSKYLDPRAIRIVTGGAQETGEMLKLKYDHIFFTGSAAVAKHIAAAAAKHLTPTVLELGGQGPAIVTKTANVDLAAKRICFAKFMNAGQICLSVNHVFVHPDVHDEFVSRAVHWTKHFHGDDSHMGTIVNERNYDRLSGLLAQTKGQVVYGGDASERASLRLDSIVIDKVHMDDSLLQSELFGPLLPIIEADYVEATRLIASKPHALAIYIFSSSQEEVNYILDNSLSGGVTVNDTFMHAGVPNAPFGGVGEAGNGYYHGKFGVDAFSHTRTVVEPPMWLERLLAVRYPPYKVKNTSKIAVKNKLGFKRGESMDDQKIRKPGRTSSWLKTLGLVLVAVWIADSRLLMGRLGVSRALLQVWLTWFESGGGAG